MAETMKFVVKNVMQHAIASKSLDVTQLSKLESHLRAPFFLSRCAESVQSARQARVITSNMR